MSEIDWAAANQASKALYEFLGADHNRMSIGTSLKTVKRKDIPVIIVWLRDGADERDIPARWRGYEVVKRDWSPALAQAV